MASVGRSSLLQRGCLALTRDGTLSPVEQCILRSTVIKESNDNTTRDPPAGKMDLATQLIFTPMIWRFMEQRRNAIGPG